MTSSWHSLSGYLYYKPGGALGRLKVRRRYWYLLDDSNCRLLCYRNQNEASRNKQPLSDLDLQTVTFNLSLYNANQFSITSGGKEHMYTADNHESMMIWLIGLQATRDAYLSQKAAKLEKVLSSDDKSLSSRDLEFKDGRLLLTTPSAAEQQRRRRLQQKLSESNDGTADLFPVNQSMASADTKSLSRSLDSFRSSGQYQSFGQKDSMGPDTPDQVSLNEEVFHDDVTPVVGSRWRHIRKAISDITDSKVAALYTTNRDRNGSLSGTSASSDSALDRSIESDLSGRLTDTEQELISVKCELAEMKNRETCYKAVLERRDAIIVNMDEQLDELRNGQWDRKTADRKMRDQLRVLQNQNHFLNEEIRKLGTLRQQEQTSLCALYSQLEELQVAISLWRHDYLYLLQSSVRVPTGDIADGVEMRLFGGNRHKERIQELLEDARKTNPSLPTFEKLAYSGVHVDGYGFKHQYQSEGMQMHYLCQQLHHFYLTQRCSYRQHHAQWGEVLSKAKNDVIFTKDLKVLVRGGIPPQYRREMWRHLVYHHVSDVMQEKGACYYSNLCRNAHDSEVAAHYRKQISLDLLRTMPSNVNFCHAHAPLTQKLQDVLLAFCLHNPAVGYCQGMNFITAMGLLFMEPEDAFWLLVAVTEKYFAPSYFDAHLSGAQADQQVLKDIMKVKLPELYAYMDEIDIDISTITLNWFLAVFFDAVPFETLLRIWDSFLLEGPKVLLRFALAILKMNEESLAERTDTIGVMRHLKASAGLLFDVDGLVKAAFEDLQPFPRRREIIAKQAMYLTSLKERLKKKAQQRRVFDETEQLFRSMDDTGSQSQAQLFECAATCENGLVWVCYGDQQLGRLSLVDGTEALMFDLDLELDSRITCMCSLGTLLVIGTLSGQLTAFDTAQRNRKWTVNVHDTVLDLCCHLENSGENKVFAALADGTVGVLENVDENEPPDDPLYIPVGRSPVTTLAVIDNQLWCACGNRIHILHVETLDTMDRFYMSQNPLEHILTLKEWTQGTETHGLWVAVKGSSVIELWDHRDLTCKLMFDVRKNKTVPVRKEEDGPLNTHRITTILPVGDSLWVGTGEGVLFIYDIISILPGSQSESSISDSPHLNRKDHKKGKMPTLKRCKTLDRLKTRKPKSKKEISDQNDVEDLPKDGCVPKEKKNEKDKSYVDQKVSRETKERLSSERHQKRRLSKDKNVSEITSSRLQSEDDVEMPTQPVPDSQIPKLKKASKDKRSSSREHRISSDNSQQDKHSAESGPRNTSHDQRDGELHEGYDDVFEVIDMADIRENKMIKTRTSTINLPITVTTNGIGSGPHLDVEEQLGVIHDSGYLEDEATEPPKPDINSNHKMGKPVLKVEGNGCFDSLVNQNLDSYPEVSDNVLKSVSILKAEVDKVTGELDDKTYCKKILTDMLKRVQERRALPPIESSVLGEITICPPQEDQAGDGLHVEHDISDMEEELYNVPTTLSIDVDGNFLKPPAALSPIIERSESTMGDRSSSSQSLRSVLSFTSDTSNLESDTLAIEDKILLSLTGGDEIGQDTQPRISGESMETHMSTEFQDIIELRKSDSPREAEMRQPYEADYQTNPSQDQELLGSEKLSKNDRQRDNDDKGKANHCERSQRTCKTKSKGNHAKDLKHGAEDTPREGVTSIDDLKPTDEALSALDDIQNPSDDVPDSSKSHKVKNWKSPKSHTDTLNESPAYQLRLDAKIKISDKSIRCLFLTSVKEEPIIISCSGSHGDDEAVLKWRKEPDEKLWTNEPVFEVCPFTNRPLTPLYLRKFSSQTSTESLRRMTHAADRGRSKSGP